MIEYVFKVLAWKKRRNAANRKETLRRISRVQWISYRTYCCRTEFIIRIILICPRFLSELFLEGSFLMDSRFLSLSNRANEGIWSSSDIHRIVKALMRVNGYHNRQVSHNAFEWKSTIDERIPQARGSSEIRQYWEGCNATEALFTSQLNYFLRLI